MSEAAVNSRRSPHVVMAQGVVKSYRKSRAGGVETIRVLDELDLAVAAGESVAIRGQSGIGKTTLLNVLGGLDRADAGSVLHEGEAIPSQADARARWRRGRVGFIFQFHGLLPEFSALENAALAGMVAGVERGVSFARAAELLDSVGLGPRLDHHPDELSGGEQQRVAVARALVARPRLVLADEPTGNLDPKTGDQVLDHLFALQDEHHFALLVASHSQALAARCDRVLRLSEGRLAPDPAFPPGGDDVHHGRVSS